MLRPALTAALACFLLVPPALAGMPPVPQGQALAPETVDGAGLSGVAGAEKTIRRSVRGIGALETGAIFQLGVGRVAYVDPTGGIRFRSEHLRTIRFGTNAVRITGTGLVNGRSVSFTAVGVHNATPGVDLFRVAWNGGASRGGRVTQGSVFIR